MSLLSLTSTWAAGPVSCPADLSYYGRVTKMYGTATPIPQGIWPDPGCFPSEVGCPVGFTSACATTAELLLNGRQASHVTCCPRCVIRPLFTHDAHAKKELGGWGQLIRIDSIDTLSFVCNNDQHGCYATIKPGNDGTGFTADLGRLDRPTDQLVAPTPVRVDEGKALAWGIRVVSVAPTSMLKVGRKKRADPPLREDGSIATEQPISSTSTSSESRSSDPKGVTGTSIPTGTIVGISVGIAIPVTLVSIGFFILFRREQQRLERPRIFINNYISNRLSPTELLQLTSQGLHARDEVPDRGSTHSALPSRPATSADGNG